MTTTLRRTLAAGLRNAKTLPPRTITDFVQQDVTIPDGKAKNLRFRFHRQPVTELWFRAIDSGNWNEFVFTAPSQFGKTLAGFVVPMLYHTCEIGENYVLGLPYADMAANKWEADIAPVLRSSTKLRRLIPRHGSGSGGGRVRDSITLANDAIIKLMSAGAGDGGKAGFTARVLGITEASRFSESGTSSDEADPLRQLRARQRSFTTDERATYIEGTVTQTDALPWRLKNLSTDSRILSPCPHCSEAISPEREHLCGWQDAKSENEAAAAACFCCPACGEAITEAERAESLAKAKLVHRGQTMDKKGRIHGTPPDTKRLWFRCSAWHNLFLSAGDIARDEWKAAQIPENSPERISAEKELCQFVWCIPWDPPKLDTDLDLDKDTIDRRRLALPARVVPKDYLCLTVGTDLGSKTGWHVVLATLPDLSRHIVDYGSFDVPSHEMPLDEAIIKALQELRKQTSAGYVLGTEGGRVVTPDESWYDAGFQADAVAQFVRAHSKSRINAPDIAAYGRGHSMFHRTTYTAPKKKTNAVRQIDPSRYWFLERDYAARTTKLFWDADSTKYQVLQALTLQQGQPGSITLFAGTSKTHEQLVRHLTNEPLVNVTTPLGGITQKFVRKGDNHLLDALAMAWRASERFMWRSKIGPHAPKPDEATAMPASDPTSTTDDFYESPASSSRAGESAEPSEPPAGDAWYGDATEEPTEDWYS